MKKKKPLLTIGWREWIALPEQGIEKIKAKIDTGARTSSLHAAHIHYVQRGEKTFVSFKIYPEQRSSKFVIATESELIDEKFVKSSTGNVELRPVILIRLKLMGESWLTKCTLARRDEMGFRMLLGRHAIRKKFLVDASRSFIAGHPKT
jgi:hypothetical protein